VLPGRAHPAAEVGGTESKLQMDDAVLLRVFRSFEGDALDPVARRVEAPVELELGEEAQEAGLLPLHGGPAEQLALRELDPDIAGELDKGGEADAAFEVTVELDLREGTEIHYLPVNFGGRF